MKKESFNQTLITVLTFIFLAAIIFARVKFSAGFDFRNTNFSFFWLAGRMVLDGENPYDETQYLAGHDANNMEWKPNQIFPYPLPLALLCIPLGFFSMETAFSIWQVFSLLSTAVVAYYFLEKWKSPPISRFFAPLFFFLVFFGPLFMTVRIGNIGTLALLFLFGALVAFDKENSFLAGIFLALTMLKPPQGLPILLLTGVWLYARKDWKAFAGIAAGGLALLVIGLIQDPLWLGKFLDAGDAVMNRTQGVHANVWAAAYLTCDGSTPCNTLLGAAFSLSLLGLGGYFLWQNHARWPAWEALNFILPVAFTSTIYLWVYDQIVYVIPLIWAAGAIVKLTKTYVYAAIYLILIDFISMSLLLLLAKTESDLWGFITSAMILGSTLILLRWKPAIDKPPVTA